MEAFQFKDEKNVNLFLESKPDSLLLEAETKPSFGDRQPMDLVEKKPTMDEQLFGDIKDDDDWMRQVSFHLFLIQSTVLLSSPSCREVNFVFSKSLTFSFQIDVSRFANDVAALGFQPVSCLLRLSLFSFCDLPWFFPILTF